MKGQLENLVHLQEIDSRFSLTQNQKAQQPIEVEKAQMPLQTAQKALAQAKAALESTAKIKRGKERELHIQEEQIEKLKARQSDIKTNKEYQAHLREIEKAQQEKSHTEDELLILMDESDQEAQRALEQEQSIQVAEKAFRSKENELAQYTIQLDELITKLEADRSGILKQIDEKLLRNYNRLKSTCNDLAVVPILQGSCGGCHMNIPPQLIAEVKSQEKILTCSYCHRILYQPESIQRPEPPPTEELKPLSSQAKGG